MDGLTKCGPVGRQPGQEGWSLGPRPLASYFLANRDACNGLLGGRIYCPMKDVFALLLALLD